MSNTKQTERDTLASRETLITMIETLSGAYIFNHDTQTIVYARCARAGHHRSPLAELCGNPMRANVVSENGQTGRIAGSLARGTHGAR